MEKIIRLGLIGKPISHSKSPEIFAGFFSGEGISDAQYQLFELNHIDELPDLIAQNPLLGGFNVTIPYKTEIFKYLSRIDPKAEAIGAVNTVKIIRNPLNEYNSHPPKNSLTSIDSGIELIGFNTDFDGFDHTINVLPDPNISEAYILGTGGSSKAVAAVLGSRNIPFKFVSRHIEGESENSVNYSDFESTEFKSNTLIINTTPLGMWPNVDSCPPIPWHQLPSSTQFIDLVYNPEETLLIKSAKQHHLFAINGRLMLQKQAESAWEIFKG